MTTGHWTTRAAALDPATFRRYLRGTGWTELPLPHSRVWRFVHRSPEGEVTTEIPTDAAFLDYAKRLHEALDALSFVEQRPPEAIVATLEHPDVDRLQLRLTGESVQDGTIPLQDALRIRSARKQLLLAAAHSALEPRPWFSRLGRAEPLELLAVCREAPPQVGSFVSEVLIPVSPALPPLSEEVEAPFARRTTALLARALLTVSDLIARGDDTALLQHAQDGVSANLLAALAELGPPDERGALEFTMSWTPRRPAPDLAKRPIRFDRSALRLVGEAARVLRETSEAPGSELEGFIARLERSTPDDPTAPGVLVLATALEGRPGTSRVQLHLPPDLYQRAVEAHQHAARVRVTGTLVREGRRSSLRDVSGFTIDAVDE
jgi:hypothetical protein